MRPHGIDEESDNCTGLDVFTTGPISNDSMDFIKDVALDVGVPNPLVFTGKTWPVSFNLYINDRL